MNQTKSQGPDHTRASGQIAGTESNGQWRIDASPYLSARREWDERYGSLITRARNWRFSAVLALGVALISTCGLIALSMKAKVVPYVVAIDNLGRVLAAGPAD